MHATLTPHLISLPVVCGSSYSTEPSKHPADYWAESAERHVLFLDTYELLAPLDEWLRDVFFYLLYQKMY